MPLKPVVFIPGFPASELRLAATGEVIFPPPLGTFFDDAAKQRLLRLLTGPDDPPGSVVAGEPIRTVLDIAKQAQSLYDLLTGTYGYTTSGGTNFAPVGWDWRGAVDADRVQADVAAAIDSLAAQNGGAKVVVIIHSTGGPVFRRCLELQPELAAKVERILALGIPWAGTLKSFPFITTGEAFGPFPPLQLSAQEVQGIMSHAQAAYDLLPPDPAKTDMTDANGRPLDLFVDGSGAQQGPLVDLLWIRGGAEQDYMRRNAADADRRLGRRGSTIVLGGGAALPPITNIGGWGTSTQTQCTMDGAGQLVYTQTPEGDGTIPLVSARWLRGAMVQTYVLPIGAYPVGQIPMVHSQIWNSPPMLQIFDQVLRGAPPAPFVCCAADGNDAVAPAAQFVRLRLAAADANGLPLPNLKATVRDIAQPVQVSIPGFRAEIKIARTSFHSTGSDLCRFSIDVTWDGDRRNLPMVIHV
jgi:pimeloyl-ACP methyl ester carboxylesterase